MSKLTIPAMLRRLAPAALALAALAPGHSAAQSDSNEAQLLYEKALQAIADGRKNDASRTLMQVIEKESLHAGAYLEVALIQCSLGHAEVAERLFAIVETRFNPARPILEVIAEARETGCDNWRPASSTAVSVARGHDSNVNQGARNATYIVERDGGQVELPLQDEFLPQSDQYTALTLEHMRNLTPNGTSGFVQWLSRSHDSLRRYDSASLYAGIDTPFRFGDWPLRLSAVAGATALGGNLYQRQLQLRAGVGVPLPLPSGMQLNLTGSVSHNQFVTLTNFDSDTLEFISHLSYRGNAGYASLSHAWLTDHAKRARPGGDRHGFTTTLLARRPLWEQLSGELSLSYQSWRSSSAYVPGLINMVRDQNTAVARAILTYPVGSSQLLRLEARAVRNAEQISIFEYHGRQLQLSWHWQPE